MQLLILSILAACASAQFLYYPGYQMAYPLANQYHSQDVLGQASYGYSYPGQASATYRDAFGNQLGSYAYIDPNGREVRVSYVADSDGFRVLSNALPQAPQAVSAAAAAAADDASVLPQPVEDTAEVKAAKEEFFKLYKAAADAADAAPENNESRKKRQLLLTPFAPPLAYAPLVAKTTITTPYYERNEAALTPAATTKIDLKEHQQDVYTPLAYPAYHLASPLVIAGRKKRQALFYGLPAVAPLEAQATVKTVHYEADQAALTPAATTKLQLKEQQHQLRIPLAYPHPYPLVAAVAAAPVAAPVAAVPHFGYHIVA